MNKHCIVINGKHSTTKQDLMNEFNANVGFPDYFSHNWDSFEEVLAEILDENEKMEIILHHSVYFLENEKGEKATFYDVLASIQSDFDDQRFFLTESI